MNAACSSGTWSAGGGAVSAPTGGSSPNIDIGSNDGGPRPTLGGTSPRGATTFAMKSASGSRSPSRSPNIWSIEASAAFGTRSSNTPRPTASGAGGAAATVFGTGTGTGAGSANGSKSWGSSMCAGGAAGGAHAADDDATPAVAGTRPANGSANAAAGATFAGAKLTRAESPSRSANGLLRESGAPRSPIPATAPTADARAARPPPYKLVARRCTPGVDASTAARPRTTVSASASGASSWITSSR